MATKRLKAMTRKLVDSVRTFLRQPTSDQSYEVPSDKDVRKAKSAASSPVERKPGKPKTAAGGSRKRRKKKR